MATLEEGSDFEATHLQQNTDFEEPVLISRLDKSPRQVKNKAVEDALAPLIEQVISASEGNTKVAGHTQSRRDKYQNVSKLVQLVDKATRNFIVVGEEIASENPDFQDELLLACDEVRSAGEAMGKAASQFALDTSQANRRAIMIHTARELLMSVVRLMAVADDVDMNNLTKASGKIQQKLNSLHLAKNEDELKDKITECAPDISYITQVATLRQKEFKCEASYQLLVATQSDLNQASRMLTSVSKAFLQCPETKANQEYVITRILDALKTLSLLAYGEEPEISNGNFTDGEMFKIFQEFEIAIDQVVLVVLAVTQSASDSQTEAWLNVSIALDGATQKLLTAASEMASSAATRDRHHHNIITLSGILKNSVQHFLVVLNGDAETMEREDHKSKMITEQADDLKKEKTFLHRVLLQALVDHISDVFVNAISPMAAIFEPAASGDRVLMESTVENYLSHTESIINVARLACSYSDDLEGIRSVGFAVKNIQILAPQVVSAANALYTEPNNTVIQKNASVFKETWVENLAQLTDAVFAITITQCFVSVLGMHIFQDGQTFLESVKHCNGDDIQHAVELLRGRCRILLRFIKIEMKENPSHYTEEQTKHVEEAMHKLKEKSLLWLCKLASSAATTLESTSDPRKVNRKALEEATQDVLDQVRTICSTVAPETNEMEELIKSKHLTLQSQNAIKVSPSPRKFQRTPRNSLSSPSSSATLTKETVTQLSEEQKAQLVKAAQDLNAQQEIFDVEVNKWDENSNDIVLLAKEMSNMMTDMSDFTRGAGPLHTAADVIITARDIARAGEYFNQLVADIAKECPDEMCRKDVLAYLERVRLYCHQLKITSAVQADLSTSTKETVDNASSLMIASKNLMTAVVDTVKASYVASTAIARAHGGTMPEQFIQWKLSMPRKKKLYRSESSESHASLSGNLTAPPLQELRLFRQGRKDKQSLHILPETEQEYS